MTAWVFRYRLVSWLLILTFLGGGWVAHGWLNHREDPDVPARQAQIVAVFPGADLEQVELLVADRLEQALLDINELQKVETRCRPGVAILKVQARDEVTDLNSFWNEVRHRLADVQGQLPAGALPLQINDHFGDTAALIYGVVWPQASPRQREDLVRRLRDRLRPLPEVGETQLLGVVPEQIEILVTPERLALQGVSLPQLIAKLSGQNALPLSGTQNLTLQRLSSRISGSWSNWAELANTPIAPGPLYLKQLGEVVRTHVEAPSSRLRIQGQESVALAVTLRTGYDILRLGERVEAEVERFRRELPQGVQLIKVNDLPTSVRGRISEFQANLRDGVVLILGFTLLFMGWRSAMLVGLLLPLTIVGTYAAMFIFGRDLQQMSITALIIALGLVVDNSVVVVDNIEHQMSQGLEPTQAALRGAQQLQVPLLTSNLTTVAAFLPLVTLGGGKGDFIEDLGWVTSLTTLVSLLLNLTLMPLLCAYFLRPVSTTQGVRRHFFSAVDALRRGVLSAATASLAHPWRLTLLVLASVPCGLALIPALGVQFFPSAQRTQMTIEVWRRDGATLASTEGVVKDLESFLLQQKEVTSVVAYLGRGGPRFYYNVDPEPPWPSYAQVVVNTKSVKATEALLKKLPRQHPQARLVARKLEQGPPVGAPIHLRLTGQNAELLRKQAGQLIDLLLRTQGIAQAFHDWGEPAAQINLVPDQDRLAQIGVTAEQLLPLLQVAQEGLLITSLREGDRQIPVYLRLPAERRQPQTLASLPLLDGQGKQVPLGHLVQTKLEGQELRRSRFQRQRTVNVYAYPEPGLLPSRVLSRFWKQVPKELPLSYAGEQEEVDKSFRELGVIFFLTVMGQLLIVAAQFNRASIAATILATIPLALPGALVGLWLTRQVFGFTAFLGLITLGGVVTNHAIMFFEYTRQQEGPLEEAMLKAGSLRLRPILLTVLLSIAGLLPLALGGGNLWPPMAWGLIFGLLYSLPLALIVVPSIYKATHQWRLKAPIGLVLLALTSQAQAEPLTLEQLQQRVLQLHPKVQEFEARWAGSQAGVEEARAPRLPQLQINSSLQYLDPTQRLGFGPVEVVGSVSNNWSSGIRLSQSLFSFGRLEWAEMAAQERQESAFQEYRLSRLLVWEEATLSWLNYLEAQRSLEVAESSRKARQRLAQDTQVRFRVGQAARYELLRAQAEELGSAQTVFEAQAELVRRKVQLAQLLQLDSQQLEVDSHWTWPELDLSLPKGLERALQMRPEIDALEHAILASQARQSSEQQSDAPHLGLQLDYQRQNPVAFRLGEQFAATLVLQIPLFDGGASDARSDQAHSQTRQLQAQLAQFQRDIRIELESLQARLLADRAQLDSAKAQLAAAQEAERLSQLRYRSGMGTLLESFDSERERVDAERKLVVAEYRLMADLCRWSRATLQTPSWWKD
jgi:multidrug efflux pump subunit AcrB/outer membrane protein TolC